MSLELSFQTGAALPASGSKALRARCVSLLLVRVTEWTGFQISQPPNTKQRLREVSHVETFIDNRAGGDTDILL
jgi:hypothetical protein